jgi:hypothetical protein
MSELKRYYDVDQFAARVWALNHSTALVQLTTACVVLVPLGDHSHEGEPPGVRRENVNRWLETPPDAELTLALGELTSWASRRGDLYRFTRLAEKVLGAVFDRVLIRESLQWLFENRIEMSELVRLRLVKAQPGAEQYVLVMQCDRWIGLVMCCWGVDEVGSDSLPELDGRWR